MKVVIWPALGRVGSYATGVGRHVLRMSTGLAARSGWDTQLLFSSDLWTKEASRAEPSLMDVIPGVRLPFSRRFGELCWRCLGAPALDRWVEGADWVYCPKELYVPVRESRYAVTVHDLFRLEPEYRHLFEGFNSRWRWPLLRALREADLVLAVSEFTRQRVVSLAGISAEKIKIVGNGVDDGFFAISTKEQEEVSPFPGERYLLAVGGITRKKGGADLLALARELERLEPMLKVVVTGPVEAEFVGASRDLRNLRLLNRGFPDPSMHRLVRAAEAILVLSEYEGFGISALEGMAAGVPVIAARRAALPEVVGEGGCLVDPGQPLKVAEITLDILGSDDQKDRLVLYGQHRVQRYRWSYAVDRLCAAFSEFDVLRRYRNLSNIE